jgi:hypothetical protein
MSSCLPLFILNFKLMDCFLATVPIFCILCQTNSRQPILWEPHRQAAVNWKKSEE